MTRRFSIPVPTIAGMRGVVRSPAVGRQARAGTGGGQPSNGRSWSAGPYPSTNAERWAHFRMSLGRTLATLALSVAALAAIALISATMSP